MNHEGAQNELNAPLCMGLRVTQNAYFSLITHTKQLLLVTFCDPTAGTGVSFRTDAQRTDSGGGRTDRRGSRNSYLDSKKYCSTFDQVQRTTTDF